MIDIIVWMLLPTMFVFAFWYYLYRIIKVALNQIIGECQSRKRKCISIIISAMIALPAMNLYSVWSIFIMHVAALSIVMDLFVKLINQVYHGPVPILLKRVYYSRIIAIVAVIIILTYGYWNMKQIRQTEYTITTTKHIREEGYEIALFADLHFGTTMDLEQLDCQLDRIEKQEPDLVLLDGDIVDENTSLEEMEAVFLRLGRMKSNFGVYYVYGNHDKSSYSQNPNYTEEQLESAIISAGIMLLEDSNITINDELVLVGRGDTAEKEIERMTASQLLEQVDTSKELIVMDHQPVDYEEVQEAGFDLILSGHTHGGQIWPTGLIAKMFHTADLNYGYEKMDNLQAIVTSGIAGWGYPIRTQQHSEYVWIHLQ